MTAGAPGIRPEYAAAIWALVFAGFHILWGAGWYVGLDPVTSRAAFSRPWFVAYDLVAAGLCLVAAVVVLAGVQRWGRRIPRVVLAGLLLAGTGVLTLRAGGGLLQRIYWLLSGRANFTRSLVWEVWFCVGAILFGLSLRRFRRDAAAGQRVQL